VYVQAYQITSSHEAEMLSKWIHPDIAWVLRIPYRNMARDSFCEAFAGEISENGRSVNEDVCSFFCMGGECWNS
jgi:hypothetical protein